MHKGVQVNLIMLLHRKITIGYFYFHILETICYSIAAVIYFTKNNTKNTRLGGRHCSMVSSAPTILQPLVRIPSTPSMLFSICIVEIVIDMRMREGLK